MTDVFAALRGSWAWGQLSRHGPFHALRPSPFDEDQWVPACNRFMLKTDLQLASLDDSPGPSVCSQPGCARALHAWKRVHGASRET